MERWTHKETAINPLPQSQAITKTRKHPQTGAKGIPLELILQYADKKLTDAEIAQMLGCDRSNITRRLKRAGYDRQIIDAFTKQRADILARKQGLILNEITPEKLKKCSPRDLAVSFGVLYDKERLERGQSTSNVAYQDISREMGDIDRQIAEMEARLCPGECQIIESPEQNNVVFNNNGPDCD